MVNRFSARCTLAVVLLASVGMPSTVRAQESVYRLIDRKFPGFTFCPIETRNGNLITFQAPASGSIRITFAAANEYPNEQGVIEFNDPAIDNVYVMSVPEWTGNSTECETTCFVNRPGAPTFPGSAEILSELSFAEQFHSDPHTSPTSPWLGGTWYNDFTAPHGPLPARYCEPGFSGGGSLQLGNEALGDVQVSASVTVGGLMPGTTYVVFCWFRIRNTSETPGTTPARLEVTVQDAVPSDLGLEMLAAPGIRLDMPRPNPFNPMTSIFYGHAGGRLDISIYDLRGRLVRQLLVGTHAAGEGTVGWDGKDNTGRASPSGLYVVRMRSEAEERSKKAVLVR